MTIRDILQTKGRQVYSIGPEQTLLRCVALLVEHGIGALLVRESTGAVVGIVSERDVLRASLQHSADLNRIPVRDAMTRKVIVCVPTDELDYARGIMTANRIRHLPVTDGEEIVGLVSIGDLVKASLEEVEYENRYLKEYITTGR